jgi:hypothetical protein
MRVAFATCSAMPDGWIDDREAARLLEADFRVWDDAAVDWYVYDRVVLRSVWDYSWRLDEFLAWCHDVGPARLRNPPKLVEFNADKRYLADISVPSVPTRFIVPGDELPRLDGELVVKPSTSAGARHTGRFASPAGAIALIEEIHASGRVALVQPYLPAVDRVGETSVVYIGGETSHVLCKRAVLRGEGIAPVAEGELGVAAAMLEDDLVVAGTADAAQLSLANAAHAELSSRFGVPVYARVDLVHDRDGKPVVSELEVIEPSLYLSTAPGASARLAAALRAS